MIDSLRAATTEHADHVPQPRTPHFTDRRAAGRALVPALAAYAARDDVIVLGLARGGVIVAHEVAAGLGATHDVVVARKLGVPGIPEVALGAITEGDGRVVHDEMVDYLGIPDWMTAAVATQERHELQRRVRRFRGARPLPTLRDRVVIVVDDGLASGATMRAAVESLRTHDPARIVAAVPVASRAGLTQLAAVVDELVTLGIPEPFGTVSDVYDDFSDVPDDAVLAALAQPIVSAPSVADVPPPAAGTEAGVHILLPGSGCMLAADVGVPRTPAQGLVIFAHGGGSSRNSFRNRFLAAWLRMRGWATIRVDLLMPDEAERDAVDGAQRFDVPRITARLVAVIDWAVGTHVVGAHRIVLFGASTGAAAALAAAAERRSAVHGVMSRGGRVDLAADAFPRIRVPMLLVVGTTDAFVLRVTRRAIPALPSNTTLRLVRGAGHVFDEPAALGAVGAHVEHWLDELIQPRRSLTRTVRRWCSTLLGV